MVVFPPHADEQREVIFTPPAGKPPLFIMLDGTAEARKMFRKSPYLDNLPVISVDLSRLSAYRLREAHAKANIVLPKWPSLADMAGDTGAAQG